MYVLLHYNTVIIYLFHYKSDLQTGEVARCTITIVAATITDLYIW